MSDRAKRGRPRAGQADLIQRRQAYERAKAALAMPAARLAAITGLSIATIRSYPGADQRAPTWSTIAMLQEAAIRKFETKAAAAKATAEELRAEAIR